VLFGSFTGGAHCCDSYELVTAAAGRLRSRHLGQWNGGLGIQDVDGDGRMELVAEDQRFLYRFDSYAASAPPPMIYELHDGRLVDVSDRAAYAAYFAGKLGQYRQGCEQSRANGVCASYLAVAARAGKMGKALTVFERSLPVKQSVRPWTVPAHCGSAIGLPGCAHEKPEKTFPTLRAAVDWFLRDLGYLPQAPQ
jgi:hypothetical protein